MKSKSLYIASLQKNAGSLIVSMGIMEILKKSYARVGFFRPFVKDLKNDKDTLFMIEFFNLDMKYEECVGFDIDEVVKKISQNREHELIESLLDRLNELVERFDFVLIEGHCKESFSASLDFDINLTAAKNFGSMFVAVLNGKDRDSSQVLEDVKLEHQSLRDEKISHFATFVNRVDCNILEKTLKESRSFNYKYPLFFLPEVDELDRPTLNDLMQSIDCELLLGEQKDLKRVIRNSKIAAMHTDNFIEHIENGDLVITPGDRSDILIASYAALNSRNLENISGILLTGGIIPKESILNLLKGFEGVLIPILSLKDDTWSSALKVEHIEAKITPKSERKIALVQGLFSSYVDEDAITKNLNTEIASVVTPAMFEYGLFKRAKLNRKKIVLPESEDERILRAAEILINRDVVDIILIGKKEDVLYRASQIGISLHGVEIINPKESPLLEEFAKEFYEMRRHKGLKEDIAHEAMLIPTYFATMMVYKDLADGMVSGAVNTTADTIRPALQIIKTKPGISIVSSVFFMCLDSKVLVYGDCAINQNPTADELAEIAISSAQTALQFGIDPKIAMLSYSTGDSGSGDDVDKVKLATMKVKEKRADLLVEGPIQYDAAIDLKTAQKKLPNSKVAGQATIFIFPDLNTGNNTYKAVQRSANALAIGPVLQGLKKPVNDLSRGCLVADIVNTVAITAIQAQE